MNLDQYGLQFGTDKSSAHHDYLHFYERFLGGLRNSAARILEIGIFDGASLKTWEAYFTASRIVGADINPATLRFAGGRVAVEILDQSNIEQLVALAVKHGPFDIIIEDGSHQWEHQITSLRTLFPFLKKGGFYIVEDLQTNYGSMEKDYRGTASLSCMEYLKKAVDLRVADDQLDIAGEEDAFLRSYARHMNLMFYRRSCLIEKTYRGLAGDQSGEALIPTPADGEEISISAHVGNLGDIHGISGFLRSGHPHGNIQGFAIYSGGGSHPPLLYRVRLADGTWTGWMGQGEFAGTKGINQDLTGLSVRLTEPRGDWDLRAAALFRGQEEPVTAGNGEACVAASGSSALHGMQIILHRQEQQELPPTSAASTTAS